MRKFIVISLLSMSLVACSEIGKQNQLSNGNITGFVVHKYSVKHLAELDSQPRKCVVTFYNNGEKKSDIDTSVITNFPCNKIKYFKENSDVETNNDKDDNL